MYGLNVRLTKQCFNGGLLLGIEGEEEEVRRAGNILYNWKVCSSPPVMLCLRFGYVYADRRYLSNYFRHCAAAAAVRVHRRGAKHFCKYARDLWKRSLGEIQNDIFLRFQPVLGHEYKIIENNEETDEKQVVRDLSRGEEGSCPDHADYSEQAA